MRNLLLATTLLSLAPGLARSAQVGINTQLSFPEYANLSVVQKALKDSGITNLRDNLSGYMANPAPYDALAAQGYTFNLIAPNDGPVDVASTVAAYHAFAAAHPGALTTIEGSNEIDGWPVTFNGQSGIPGAVAWQDALYAAVKADPLLKNIPVIGQSCGQCSPDQFAQLNAGAHDINNAHVYVQGGATADDYFKTAIPYEVPNAGGKPTVVTETGYTGAGGDLAGLISASAKAGAAGTYIYALLPSGPTAELQGYGIYNSDGTPKSEATALRATLSGSATTAPSTVQPTSPVSQAPLSIKMASIDPGTGSITDSAGHLWAITASGSITKDGAYVNGGGGTSALTIVNGIVYGKDSGHGPVNPGGWFKLSGDSQYWQVSDAPNGTINPPGTAPSAIPKTAQIGAYTGVCTTAVPHVAASAGGFGVLDGQIYPPGGSAPFIPRGINVRSNELGDILSGAVTSKFPGLNFVRINARSLDSPASLTPAIEYLTKQGIVVELEDHPDAGGGRDSWADEPGDVAWYGQIAAAFKDNPYVWFGTFNEPALANLSAWQKATYDAIRGAGNNNPILMEANSWAEGDQPVMLGGYDNTSIYKNMTNIAWDVHYYGWLTGYSTDQQKNNDFLAKMIAQLQNVKSADGTMPVVIGEFGDSTNGSTVDPNGTQAINAVLHSGYGSAAWSWIDAGADALRNKDGNLSNFGQAVAAFTAASGNPGCAESPVVTGTAPQQAPADLGGPAPITAPSLDASSSIQTAPPLAANPMSISDVAALAAAGR